MKEVIIETIKAGLKNNLADLNVADVEYISTVKNNGVTHEGFRVVFDSIEISPCLYLDNLDIDLNEMSGIEIQCVINKLSDRFRTVHTWIDDFDSNVLSFENTKNNIFATLVNYERNKSVLEGHVHKRYLDLAIVPRVRSKVNDSYGSYMIPKGVLKEWNITTDDCIETALSNYKNIFNVQIVNLQSFMEDIGALPPDSPPSEPELYIVSNDLCYYGAAAILLKDSFSDIYELVEDDYILIPSSINEFLVCPYNDDLSIDYMKNMVREINSTVLKEEEYLSDNIYRYFHSTNALSIVE